MGFYDNLPGYKNPLGDKTPSWGGSNNIPSWGGSNGSVDWKGGYGVDNSGLWDKSFGRYNDPSQSYLNQTKNKLFDTADRKRRDQDSGRSGGSSSSSGGGVAAHSGEVLPGFGVYESGKFAPVVINPPERGGGRFGQLGGMAGALGTGLGIFGPLGSLGGSLVGGVADQIFG
jgi:hypothetical protein